MSVSRSARRPRRGVALLLALWLVVMLGAIGLEVSLAARGRRLAALNVLDDARARATALGGLEDTRARLEQQLRDIENRLRPGGAGIDPWLYLDTLPVDEPLGNGGFQVRVESVGARLNLNRASEEELRRLMIAIRIDAGDADRVAQAVADWRDPDDLRRARGAERAEYLAEGRLELPTNREFVDVGELRHVLGVSPALLARLRPYLTVVGSGQVNLNVAPHPVLLALPGMTLEAADVAERARLTRAPLASSEDLARRLSPDARATLVAAGSRFLLRAAYQTRELQVTSIGHVAGSAMRVRADALLVRAGVSVLLVWKRIA